MKDWRQALEDALVSVSKDSKYIKGYFRLSSAQTELQMFDDAETTLKLALSLEPNNEVITRQIKALKTKKTAAANAAAAAKRNNYKKLDEAQMKEVCHFFLSTLIVCLND
jgi:tetratricopeptide (TPR) repeat protein